MKIIEIPVFNEDGSIMFTSVVSAEEAKVLLQFALNFLAGTGFAVMKTSEQIEQEPKKFND